MAEVLVDFSVDVGHRGLTYHPRAIGALAEDGMWQGWLEFLPVDGGEVIVSGVESTQPEREHLVYWATGLTPVYLEGALQRALKPATVRVRVVEEPVSHAPAQRVITHRMAASRPEAVLDPFEIGSRSLDVLRQELTALNRPRLLNIIAAYDLNPGGEEIDWMTDAQLVTFIVTATEAQLLQRQR
jgi:hypothetical protein